MAKLTFVQGDSGFTVLEIVVRHRTFSDQSAHCLTSFIFGRTECPDKLSMIWNLYIHYTVSCFSVPFAIISYVLLNIYLYLQTGFVVLSKMLLSE